MNEALFYGVGGAVVVVVLLLAASIRIVPEYERGVIFRLGRVLAAKGPGLFFIIPVIDRVVKVSLRTMTQDIPPQDIITKDNVTVRVNAVTYYPVELLRFFDTRSNGAAVPAPPPAASRSERTGRSSRLAGPLALPRADPPRPAWKATTTGEAPMLTVSECRGREREAAW